MKTLKVDLGERSYDIIIGEGALAKVSDFLPQNLPKKKTIIITDENVAAEHLSRLENLLGSADVDYQTLVLPAGEATKSFENLEKLTSFLLENKVDRRTNIIAFGGGVIGDLVGFAASITLRGVGFIQIPTTLLAQVDSSVGGKTAINSQHGKNLIGAFHQPVAVLADTDLLATLPRREFLAGYAEVVKYGLINKPEFFEWLDNNSLEDKKNLIQAIYESCKSKAEIVAQDEREKGVRALLNLGHTFGHALEAETGFSSKLLHGEAVALGMIMAFKFSKAPDMDKVIAHFERVGLPTNPREYVDDWDAERLLSYMYSDKKAHSGKLVFILTRGIGQAYVAEDVDAEEVKEFLEKL